MDMAWSSKRLRQSAERDSALRLKGSKVQTITPLQAQYAKLRKQYPDAVLLFRVGDYWESFGEDAEVVNHYLKLPLTKGSGPSPFDRLAGFDKTKTEEYLPLLLKAGYRVAFADQIDDPSLRNQVRRGVTRVHEGEQKTQPMKRKAQTPGNQPHYETVLTLLNYVWATCWRVLDMQEWYLERNRAIYPKPNEAESAYLKERLEVVTETQRQALQDALQTPPYHSSLSLSPTNQLTLMPDGQLGGVMIKIRLDDVPIQIGLYEKLLKSKDGLGPLKATPSRTGEKQVDDPMSQTSTSIARNAYRDALVLGDQTTAKALKDQYGDSLYDTNTIRRKYTGKKFKSKTHSVENAVAVRDAGHKGKFRQLTAKQRTGGIALDAQQFDRRQVVGNHYLQTTKSGPSRYYKLFVLREPIGHQGRSVRYILLESQYADYASPYGEHIFIADDRSFFRYYSERWEMPVGFEKLIAYEVRFTPDMNRWGYLLGLKKKYVDRPAKAKAPNPLLLRARALKLKLALLEL